MIGTMIEGRSSICDLVSSEMLADLSQACHFGVIEVDIVLEAASAVW